MTGGRVGWYAHHSGWGHVTRAVTVARRTRCRVDVLSSAERPAGWPRTQWVALPADDAFGGHDHQAGGVLHWAPLGHEGYYDRMAEVAAWIRAARPALVVIDVSVELTLLCRSLGVPVAVVVMAGDRRDRAHQLAYDAATWLLAAWPRSALVVRGWRAEWDAKTHWVGGFSRFDGRVPVPSPGRRQVVCLWGGHDAPSQTQLGAARQATPTWTWSAAVQLDPHEVWDRLAAADVVVTHAGQNAVAEVAAAQRRAVVVPRRRPHDEQLHLAVGLHRLALQPAPLRGWPEPGAWADLLEGAEPREPARWATWSDGHGAHRLAAVIDALVDEAAA